MLAERCSLCGCRGAHEDDCGTELALLRAAIALARPRNVFFVWRA